MKRKPIVLLVDDNQEILDLLGDTLRANDFEVLTMTSVEDAKKVLAFCLVDMIVADLNFPSGETGDHLLDHAATHQPSSGRVLYSSAPAAPEGCVHRFVQKLDIEGLVEVLGAMAGRAPRS